MANNWFSNLLPAIESAGANIASGAKQVGNTLLQGVNDYGKNAASLPIVNLPFIKTPTQGQVINQVAPNSPIDRLMQGNVQQIPKDTATKIHDQQHKRPGESDDQFISRTNEPLIAGIAGISGGMPEASAEKTLATDIAENVKPGAVESPVRVTLKPSVYGAGREAAVQNTVDNIIPGATGAEKYKNLEPTMSKLGDQIDQIMSKDPKSAPLERVMQDYDKNLADQGVYRTSGTTRPQIQKIAQKYITDLTNEASGNNSILNPSEISDAGIQNIKQKVNADAQSIFRKIENGTSLTDKDKVILAARQTLDDTLTTLHPEIKELTTQQSHLYDAADSLSKGRDGEIKTAQKLAEAEANKPPFSLTDTVLGPELSKFLPPIVKTPIDIAARNPLKALKGAGILGGVGLVANAANDVQKSGVLNPAENSLAGAFRYAPSSSAQGNNGQPNQEQGQNSHTSIIAPGVNTSSFSQIKPNNDGSYSLPQSAPEGQNTRHYMTSQDYQTGLNSLASKYPAGDRDPAYTLAKTQLDTQFSQDQKQADEVFKGNNVKNFMDNATTYNAEGNDLLNTLTSMPNATGFWNGVSKAGSIRAYTDPQFANELQQIDSFNREFASAYESVTGKSPSDNQLLSSANSAKQAVIKYNSMMQFISGTYGKYLNPYFTLTSSTGAQTQQGTPQPLKSSLPAIAPQSASGMVQPGLQQTIQSLPAIQ